VWSKDIKIERIETVEERKNKETREGGGVHDETSNRGILGQVVSGATFCCANEPSAGPCPFLCQLHRRRSHVASAASSYEHEHKI
jgi:hypothetical protein